MKKSLLIFFVAITAASALRLPIGLKTAIGKIDAIRQKDAGYESDFVPEVLPYESEAMADTVPEAQPYESEAMADSYESEAMADEIPEVAQEDAGYESAFVPEVLPYESEAMADTVPEVAQPYETEAMGEDAPRSPIAREIIMGLVNSLRRHKEEYESEAMADTVPEAQPYESEAMADTYESEAMADEIPEVAQEDSGYESAFVPEVLPYESEAMADTVPEVAEPYETEAMGEDAPRSPIAREIIMGLVNSLRRHKQEYESEAMADTYESEAMADEVPEVAQEDAGYESAFVPEVLPYESEAMADTVPEVAQPYETAAMSEDAPRPPIQLKNVIEKIQILRQKEEEGDEANDDEYEHESMADKEELPVVLMADEAPEPRRFGADGIDSAFGRRFAADGERFELRRFGADGEDDSTFIADGIVKAIRKFAADNGIKIHGRFNADGAVESNRFQADGKDD